MLNRLDYRFQYRKNRTEVLEACKIFLIYHSYSHSSPLMDSLLQQCSMQSKPLFKSDLCEFETFSYLWGNEW